MTEATPQAQPQARRAYNLASMQQGAARASTSTRVAEKVETQAATTEFANIKENAFYKIMFNRDSRMEEKRDAMEALLTFSLTLSEKENQANMAAYDEFAAYLQSIRKTMAMELIGLTESEAFADLQRVFEQVGSEYLKFDGLLTPLAEGVQALFELRMADKAVEAMSEIHQDKEKEKERQEKLAALQQRQEQLKKEIATIEVDISEKTNKKFLFISTPDKTGAAIANVNLDTKKADLEKLAKDLADTLSPKAAGNDEFAKQKSDLKKLLSLSGEEHRQRQKDLIESARRYVSYTDENLGRGVESMSKIKDQVGRLADTNNNLTDFQAIMVEAVNGATGKTQGVIEALGPTVKDAAGADAPKDESPIQKRERERNLMAASRHVQSLTTSGVQTANTLGQLTQQAAKLLVMDKKVEGQIHQARYMKSSGVAEVSESLVMTITALNNAALSETNAVQQDYMRKSRERNNKILSSEFIGLAQDVADVNNQLNDNIDSISQAAQNMNNARTMMRQGLMDTQGLMNEMRSITNDLKDDVSRMTTLHSDVLKTVREGAADAAATEQAAPATGGGTPANDPFADINGRAPLARAPMAFRPMMH